MGVFLRSGYLNVHTRQGLPSIGQSGLLLLFLLLGRSKLLKHLKKLFLRLEELILEKRNLLLATPWRMNEARFQSRGLF